MILMKLKNLDIAAKICGAGGIKNVSGAILIFNEKDINLNKLFNGKYIVLKVKLGEEGVRIEKWKKL